VTGGELTVDPQANPHPDEPAPRVGGTRGTNAAHAGAEAAERIQQRLQAVPAIPDPAGEPASGVGVWNLANALTMFRLALVPFFAVFLFMGTGHETGWRIAAWAAYAAAATTDRLDGQIARARGLVTEFGKLADPIADKALVGTALIGLSSLHELSWWVTAIVLAREVGVTLLRFWVLRHGVIPASRGGKLKTLLLNVGIGLYVLPLTGVLHVVAAVILGAAVIVALVTAADYVGIALKMRKEARAG
jgi:CDP-diacylglycerol---glycerol-3-phosphate 3-phosphatidyltransferase